MAPKAFAQVLAIHVVLPGERVHLLLDESARLKHIVLKAMKVPDALKGVYVEQAPVGTHLFPIHLQPAKKLSQSA